MIRQVTFGFLISMMSSCWHSGALALRTERQSARMSKIKNGRLDQYGAEPFEQQQFGTAGVEGLTFTVLRSTVIWSKSCKWFTRLDLWLHGVEWVTSVNPSTFAIIFVYLCTLSSNCLSLFVIRTPRLVPYFKVYDVDVVRVVIRRPQS